MDHFPLCHNVFAVLGVSEGASMWLAAVPLPRVESLAWEEEEQELDSASCLMESGGWSTNMAL